MFACYEECRLTSELPLQAIESRKALLCVLAQDCDQADYTKLIQALCNEVNVHLIRVPQAVQLGEWAGVSAHTEAASHLSTFFFPLS